MMGVWFEGLVVLGMILLGFMAVLAFDVVVIGGIEDLIRRGRR